MQKCWASGLGNCKGGITREHYISKILFPNGTVTLGGFGWLNGNEKTLPIATASANILCAHHNNTLSGIDSSIGDFNQRLIDIQMQQAVFKTLTPISLPIRRYPIDGNLLEKWLAKAIIGLFCIAAKEQPCNYWDVGKSGSHNPPLEVVKAIYSTARLPEPMGFYLPENKHQGNSLITGTSISFLYRKNKGVEDGLVGGMIRIRQLQLIIWLSNLSPHSVPFDKPSTYIEHGRNFAYRPKGITFRINDEHIQGLETHMMDISY